MLLRKFFSIVALLVCGAVLASCSMAEMGGDNRHLQPLSYAAETRLNSMGSSAGAPMMIRIYKEEAVLEVWKQTTSGQFRLFQTYEICTWSGELGPKMFEGDRQAPEGFYTITPGLMNPRSAYYLSFNLGFPNRYDQFHGRTGSNLMVHGACSSAGCYAMEDEQIAEIYALARETFTGGNGSFEVQVFPFRMTPQNLARHHDSPHLAFWMNLKEGADFFEVARTPPAWDVCEGRYVFLERSAAAAAASLAGACPPVRANPSLVSAYLDRQSSDQAAFDAALASMFGQQAAAAAAAEREAARQAALAGRTEAINGFFGNMVGSVFGGTPAQQPTPAPTTAEVPPPATPAP